MNPKRSCILCATDFSPRAIDAATVAAKLSRARGESLRLVHVATSDAGTALVAARKKLAAETARLRLTGAAVESVLLENTRPSQAVLKQIERDRPSLVVVSSEGKNAFDRWAIGSFSERIAESSPAPTLVVRDPAVFETWDWARDRLKLLLGLDLSVTSDLVLRWAKEFGRVGPCDLVAAHVNSRMPTAAEAAVAPGRPVNPPALQQRLERELHRKVRDQIGDEAGPVVVRPFFGDPGPCLVEIADEVKAHVIAVGAHQRYGLGRLARFSVSRDILHSSGRNVVCVPLTVKFDPRDAQLPVFRRVLVATDFSELGNAAVPFACAACGIGGLVRLVHVTTRFRAIGRAADLRQKLRGLIPHETGCRGQPPEVEVLEGADVPAAICAEAERFGADLVCLASHGLGASSALHGSVTKGVLKKIRRPLLVIRRPEE